MCAKKAARSRPAAKPKAAAKAKPSKPKPAAKDTSPQLPQKKGSTQRAIEQQAGPYVPPDNLTEVHNTHYREILGLNAKWLEACNQHELDQAKAIESKRAADSVGKQLRDTIRRGPDPQKKLPFGEADTVNPDVDPDQTIESAIGSELGPVRIAALAKAKLTKMRQLVAHVGQNKPLSDIAGITRETAENLDDLIRAWERNRTNAK